VFLRDDSDPICIPSNDGFLQSDRFYPSENFVFPLLTNEYFILE